MPRATMGGSWEAAIGKGNREPKTEREWTGVSKFTRKELYKLVWSKPIIQVAKEIGVSDVAVAKRCRRNNIPVPGRGYWRKLETGSKLPKIPLPKMKRECEIKFYPLSEKPLNQPDYNSGAVPAYVAFEKNPENSVFVSETLSKPHPLIRVAKRSLKKSNSDRKGEGFLYSTEPCLNISVSRATRDRALCILDALIKALESRGMSVEATLDRGMPSTIVHSGKNKLLLSLHEALRSEPTGERWSDGRQMLEHVLTGRLALRVESTRYRRYNKLWSDKKLKRLETQLNSVLIGIHEGFEIEEAHRQQEEEEKRRRMEESKKYDEVSRLYEEEKRKVARLDDSFEKWQKAQQVRTYVAALEADALEKSGNIDPEGELAQWIAWIRGYADQIDPMVPTPPSLEEQLKKLRRYYW